MVEEVVHRGLMKVVTVTAVRTQRRDGNPTPIPHPLFVFFSRLYPERYHNLPYRCYLPGTQC